MPCASNAVYAVYGCIYLYLMFPPQVPKGGKCTWMASMAIAPKMWWLIMPWHSLRMARWVADVAAILLTSDSDDVRWRSSQHLQRRVFFQNRRECPDNCALFLGLWQMWSRLPSRCFFFCVISRVFTSDFSVIFSAILLEDKELKQKYWTIMNSWGENFGEKGTMRLLRQDSEDCQIG